MTLGCCLAVADSTTVTVVQSCCCCFSGNVYNLNINEMSHTTTAMMMMMRKCLQIHAIPAVCQCIVIYVYVWARVCSVSCRLYYYHFQKLVFLFVSHFSIQFSISANKGSLFAVFAIFTSFFFYINI